MANELTMSAAISYEDDSFTDEGLSLEEVVKSVTTKKFIKHKQSVGTSEEAIVLGEVTTPGYAFFINRDPTNYIELKVATGGAIFARLDPDTNQDGKGGFAFLKLGSGAAAPYAMANTAACLMEYFVVHGA